MLRCLIKPRLFDLETGRGSDLEGFRPYRADDEESESSASDVERIGFLQGGRAVVGLFRPGLGELPSLRVWDVPSGRELARFDDIDFEDDLEGLGYAISGDGSTLAFATFGEGPSTVAVLRSGSDWIPARLPGQGPLALSADGRTLALFGGPGSMILEAWDVPSSRRLATFSVPFSEKPVHITLSPDGNTLAVDREGRITLHTVRPPGSSRTLASDTPGKPRFSADGRLLMLGDEYPESVVYELDDQLQFGNSVEVWDLAVDPPRCVFTGEAGGFGVDGRRMIQVGPNQDAPPPEVGPAEKRRPSVVDLPSLASTGRVVEGAIQTARPFGPTGRILVSLVDEYRPSWFEMIFGRQASPFVGLGPRGTTTRVARVVDVDSGRILASVENARPGERIVCCELLADGRTLFIESSIRGPGQRGEVRYEFWDVPAHSSTWSYAAVLGVLASVAGRWWDVLRRRAASGVLRPRPEPLNM